MPLPNIYPVTGASGGAIRKPWREIETETEIKIKIITTKFSSGFVLININAVLLTIH